MLKKNKTKNKTNNKTNNKTTGNLGEELAADFLRKKGIKIVKQNYRQITGEIDLIASVENELIFIEVKTRSGHKFGSPAEAVTIKKQQQIIKTALAYLSENNLVNINIRFDVIAITLDKEKEPLIQHIEHAFDLPQSP